MPTTCDGSHVSQATRYGVTEEAKIAAPPAPLIAAAILAARRKPTTSRTSRNANGPPTHRDRNQKKRMTSPVLQPASKAERKGPRPPKMVAATPPTITLIKLRDLRAGLR